MSLFKSYRYTVAMVIWQIFYLVQGLMALGYDEGELGQAHKVGCTGLFLFSCLRAVAVCTALSMSYINE